MTCNAVWVNRKALWQSVINCIYDNIRDCWRGANRKALWWQFKTMSSGQQVLILFDAIFVIQFSVIRKQSS